MAFPSPPLPVRNKRRMLAWIRGMRSRLSAVTVGVGLGALLIGIAIGAAFGDRLLDPGIPVTVSNVPEINGLLQHVSRHMVIDASENPTVATVQSPDLLRQQNPTFYKDVAAGDRLIVWSDRAVLYSPSRDRILAAMIIPPGAQQAAASPTQGQALPSDLNFEIRNGTGKSGAAKVLSDRLAGEKFAVTTVGDATKTYPQTTVVLLSDKAKGVDVGTLLPLTGGATGPLPAGEKTSTADILIILGTDQG